MHPHQGSVSELVHKAMHARNARCGVARLLTAMMLAVPVLLLCSVPARADLVAMPLKINANAGSSGSFDIQFTNTGSIPVSIAAFSFGISTTSPDVTLLGGNSSFFGADSFDTVNSFPFVNSLGPLLASDLANDGLGPAVAAGATADLATITFQVSSGAPTETVGILLSPAFANSVSDDSGTDITGSLSGGTIEISGSVAVPEPSLLVFPVLIIMIFLGIFRYNQRWQPRKSLT